MSCVLRTYSRRMAADGVPPFLHPMQMTTRHVAYNDYEINRLYD